MAKTILPIKNPVFYSAVQYLGGNVAASKAIGTTPSLISYYSRKCPNYPPIELCKNIEKATKKKFTLRKLRPDIFKYCK